MTIDSDKILHDLLNSLDSLEGIRPGEIPNIALYMDQVTTFMERTARFFAPLRVR